MTVHLSTSEKVCLLCNFKKIAIKINKLKIKFLLNGVLAKLARSLPCSKLAVGHEIFSKRYKSAMLKMSNFLANALDLETMAIITI